MALLRMIQAHHPIAGKKWKCRTCGDEISRAFICIDCWTPLCDRCASLPHDRRSINERLDKRCRTVQFDALP